MHRTLRHGWATSVGIPAWTPSSFRLNPGRRSHFEKENLLDAPETSCQPSSHGRSGWRAKVVGGTQLVMHDTQVVDASNQIHAGLKGLQTMSGMATAPGQGGQTLAKGGVEPLDKGGIEDMTTFRLPQEFLCSFDGSLRDAPGDPHHLLMLGVFDHRGNQQLWPDDQRAASSSYHSFDLRAK